MTSKMISIREEVYKNLKQLKGPNESFSELIKRLITNQRKNPLRHFDIGRDLPDDFLDEFEKIVIEAKKENARMSSKRFSELWGE